MNYCIIGHDEIVGSQELSQKIEHAKKNEVNVLAIKSFDLKIIPLCILSIIKTSGIEKKSILESYFQYKDKKVRFKIFTSSYNKVHDGIFGDFFLRNGYFRVSKVFDVLSKLKENHLVYITDVKYLDDTTLSVQETSDTLNKLLTSYKINGIEINNFAFNEYSKNNPHIKICQEIHYDDNNVSNSDYEKKVV